MILDKKHEMQRKLFRQFAETEFTKEIQDELDETGEFNWDMHKKMARFGFMGVKIPKEYGGAGADSLTYALMVEELARVDAVLSIYANTSNSLGGGPLLLGGSEAQKQKYLNCRYGLAVKHQKTNTHMEQRKIYHFYKCPQCSQKVRVPKGHGKICITCPKCKMEFVRKS